MLTAPDGTPVNAVHGFVRMIQALRGEFSPEYIAAVFDSEGPSFRKTIYPEYKAHRPPLPEDLRPQLSLVRQATKALGIACVEVSGVEADDVIASYAVAAKTAGITVVIVSTDKDLMQLIEPGTYPITLWDTMKMRVLDSDAVIEKFGVSPQVLGDLLALTGDSSDNIPGVPGIGAKTAAALLAEFGSLEQLLAKASTIKQKKRQESLVQHSEQARLSRKLIELKRDVKLPLAVAELKDMGSDRQTMEDFFRPLGFKTVLDGAGRRSTARVNVRDRDDLALQVSSKPLVIDHSRDRYFLAHQEQELVAYLDQLKACERIILQISVDSADGMQAQLVGIAFAGYNQDCVVPPAYVPFIFAQGLLTEATIDCKKALELVKPLLTSATLAKIVHSHKFQAIVLQRYGIELKGVLMDPKLCSYTLDPARTSHSLVELASDILEFHCMSAEKLLGKGKKLLSFDEVELMKATTYLSERMQIIAALDSQLRQELERFGSAAKSLFTDIEMPLAQVLKCIEIHGVGVDVAVLNAQGQELGEQITKLKAEIEQYAGYAINPDSPKQLQKFLFEELGLETKRKTKTGFSTDANVLEELSVYHPVVNVILEFRSLTKLKSTYLDALPKAVDPHTKRLHTSFHQAVAQTGRLSSKDPNLQNIPIRSDVGRKIRDAFIAQAGQMLVTLDYSQIELRVLAHLSGDQNLISAFCDGVDVHRRTAAEIFEVAEGDVTSEQRRVAKAVNFGVIYGQSAFGLSRQLGIPRGKAGSYIRTYFAKIPGVSHYMDELIEVAKRRGYAETIFGRKRRIPELSSKGAAKAYGERIARNTPIQGSAADILKRAMIDIDELLKTMDFAKMVLTVHDELIFECAEDRVEEFVAVVKPRMEKAVELKVPLQVDHGYGRSWGQCKS